MELLFDVGGNQVDRQTLAGFLAVSAGAPDGLEGIDAVEQGQGENYIRITFAQDIDEAQLSEVLRVLGGSAKGDDTMTLLEPEQWAGREAYAAEAAGARRWSCPRCNTTVVDGKNSVPGIVGDGICSGCYDVEQKQSGGRTIGHAPKPSTTEVVQPAAPAPGAALATSTPSGAGGRNIQVPAHLRPTAEANAAEQAAPKDPPPTPEGNKVPQLGVAAVGLPTFANVTQMHGVQPPYPMIAFVADRECLAFWTGSRWKIVDGVVPPLI